ncbi:MAG: hypothetical protein HN704_09805 [Bacteroidetes bacterium]|jgi:hypothetical protein|nr:hypothetical protein [Bacteroidota bacterium]MBT6686840.1 hypothetical protein [Bacteroidota bacterium]MBT7144169.1 hypothetical protein [Bacteroidota bacterium]MBT7491888.1 hypothetical protein [Bacteroidota bacterium]
MKKSPLAVVGVIKCVNSYYDKKVCGFETEAKVLAIVLQQKILKKEQQHF